MYKHLIFIVFILIVSCSPREERQPLKTLNVKSEGSLAVEPDMASFSLRASCVDRDIKAAKRCLVETTNTLNKQLKEIGIPSEDLASTALNMEKQYTWNRNSRVFEGYNVSTELFIKVTNIRLLEKLYTQLIENPKISLYGLSYGHSQMDSLKDEAYSQALKNAGRTANKIASGLPGDIHLDILQVGNVKFQSSAPSSRYGGAVEEIQTEARDMMANSAPIAINNGMINVKATLYVEYLLTD